MGTYEHSSRKKQSRVFIASFDDADYLILIDLVPSLEVPNWCPFPHQTQKTPVGRKD
jgi:hypothetical protein